MGAGWASAVVCVAAIMAWGTRLEGYSHGLYPLSVLGAYGIPGARAFNVAGFIVPGVLAAMVALGLYRTLPRGAGWLPRIGARVLLLSGLAFAAQGVLPLDLQDLDGRASGLHASAWLVWWIAFVAGAPLLATGQRGTRAVTAASVGALAVMMFVPPPFLGPALAQRITLAAWLIWMVLAPWLAFRTPSCPGDAKRRTTGLSG